MFFANRTDAAIKVAAEVSLDTGFDGIDTVVGLARGGVPIANAVARQGGLPLAILLVDDVRDPDQIFVSPFGNAMIRSHDNLRTEERMFGAVAETGSQKAIALLESVARRQSLYAGGAPEMGKNILLCDDGIVSGKTVRFAARTLRQFCGVERIVLVSPVIPKGLMPADACVDEIIFIYRSSLERPPTGMFYGEFDDVSDLEVISIAASRRLPVMA